MIPTTAAEALAAVREHKARLLAEVRRAHLVELHLRQLEEQTRDGAARLQTVREIGRAEYARNFERMFGEPM